MKYFLSNSLICLGAEVNITIFGTLDTWHEIVESKDISKLRSIVHQDAVFRSPFAFKPYAGQDALVFVLSQVIEIFEDFTYQREMLSEDGRDAFLEFTAKIDDKTIKGMDLIKFDEAGLITEFEVMIRPMTALMKLAEHMAPRMAKLGI